MRKIWVFGVFLLLLSTSLFISQLDVDKKSYSPNFPRGFSLQSDWFGSNDRLEKLDILHRILNYIQEKYVEPSRVVPQAMVKRALEEVSQSVAEVRVLYPDPNKAVLMVDQARMELDTNLKTLYAVQHTLSDALKFVRSNKKSDISDRDLEVAAVNGILSTLDPHSVYLTSDLFSETKVGTTGKFGGVGIVIGLRDMKLTIIAPLENTPAYNAGLKAGDSITKIGDESTVNMSLSDAVNKMRGPKGSPVTLGILRSGWTSEKTFTLVRDIINVVSVDSDLFPNGIGYVRIKNFQENTSKDLSKHLRNLTDRVDGGLKGLILDLRSDPGGLLEQAIQVTDKFLSDGVIVSTVGAGNHTRDEDRATAPGTEPNYPMAVLVDQGSASASEIVAGALKHRNRAILIGERTFGKGTVQSLYELPEESALKLTIAQYLTPGDYSIQSIGVSPDVKLVPAIISKEYFDLYRKKEFEGEVNLERHFDNPQALKATEPQVELQYLDKIDDSDDKRFARAAGTLTPEEKLNDFVTKVAFDLLKNRPQATKQDLLAFAKIYAKEAQVVQIQKIREALLEKGIDWVGTPVKEVKNCGIPKATWKISPMVKQRVTAGDTVHFSMTLFNPGPCTLYQARGETESKTYLWNNQEFLFGKVPPNGSVTREAKISLPKSIPSALASFQTTFYEAHGIVPTHLKGDIAIRNLPKPRVAFSYDVLDRPKTGVGKGNGIIERGENVELRLIVKNISDVATENMSASIKMVSEKGPEIRIGRVPLSKLAPKEEKTVLFELEIPSRYSENSFQVDMSIIELSFRVGLSKRFTFDVLNAPKIEKISGLKTPKKDPVPIFAVPSSAAPSIAMLEPGNTIKSTEQLGDYYRVELSPKRKGWALRTHLVPFVEEPAKKPAKSVLLTWLTPPKVEIDVQKLISAPVTSQFVKVMGDVSDTEAPKDLFVLVNGKKVFYQTFANNQKRGEKQSFDMTIPLEAGPNRLVFVARNEQDLFQQEAVVVQRLVSESEQKSAEAKKSDSSSEALFGSSQEFNDPLEP